MRGAGGGPDVLARAGAGIDETAGAEFLQRRGVERPAFTLGIGGARAAAIRPFLPLKTEPSQVFDHGVHEFQLEARGIQVFDSQLHPAGLLIPGTTAVVRISFRAKQDLASPIVGFIFDGKGLMYNLTLEGSKISRIVR